MNKLLRYSFVALFAMIGLNVMADEITFNPSDFTATTSDDYSLTKSGVTVSVTKSTVTADQIRVFKSQAITISSTAGNITKAVFTCTANGTAKYGPGCFATPEVGSYSFESDGPTGTWEGNAAELSLEASTNQVRISQLVVTVSAGGGQTKTSTTIELSGDYLTKFTQGKDGDKADLPTAIVKAGDATVEGATVTWSLTKGNNWSADSDPTINGTKIEFGDHSCGDLTLKATYDGDASYNGSSKNYTLKVYKGYMAIKSILEDYPEVGSDSWKGKEAEWKAGSQISYWQVDAKSQEEIISKEALVTYVNGQYTYIKDNDGCLLLYGNELGFNQGDKISGDLGEGKIGAIYGTLKAYNGLLELATTKDDIEFVVKSSDNAVEAKTITVDQLTQENMNEYLKIENAEFVSVNGKNLTFKVGETEFAVYNQFSVDVTALEVGAVYSLYGMGCVYYKNETVTNQLYLVAFEKAPEELAVVEVETSCYVNENYLPDDKHGITIDWEAIATTLGCTTDALKIFAVLPDGTLDANYERGSEGIDGWRDAEGNWAFWNSADNLFYVQFTGLTLAGVGCMRTAEPIVYTAIFKVVDSANENGDFVTLKVTLNVTEVPQVELTLSETVYSTAAVVYSTEDVNYTEKTATLSAESIAAICEELGIQSIADAVHYGYNPTSKETVFAIAAFDGWRDANGDFKSWSGALDVPFCVKDNDGVNYLCYNIKHNEAASYKAYWILVNETTMKGVLVEIPVEFTLPTAISSPKATNVKSAIYNLAGQKVGKDYKGIIIVDGKKYIQK